MWSVDRDHWGWESMAARLSLDSAWLLQHRCQAGGSLTLEPVAVSCWTVSGSAQCPGERGSAWSLWPPSTTSLTYHSAALLEPRWLRVAGGNTFPNLQLTAGHFKSFLEEAEVNHEATGGPTCAWERLRGERQTQVACLTPRATWETSVVFRDCVSKGTRLSENVKASEMCFPAGEVDGPCA